MATTTTHACPTCGDVHLPRTTKYEANDQYEAVDDSRVLRRMKYLRRQGYANANVGALARHFRADPVQMLGAVERVKATYRRWVNAR